MTITTVMNKRKDLTGARLQFRILFHYHNGEKHGSTQTDTVLEKELRVLLLDLQALEGDDDIRLSLSI